MTTSGNDLIIINLANRQIDRRLCPDHVIKDYLGGRGLATYILLKHLGRDVGPLDPDNILVVASGLLSGSRMITTGRVHVCARSPLTGFIGTSNSGGKFGSELKACGILALVVTGRADQPVFIHVQDGRVTIRDASGAWGLPRQEAEAKLLELTGDSRGKVAVIGPAGEKLAGLASIMFGPGHACGRTGLGAVMGAKLLKGIVVRNKTPNAVKPPGQAMGTVKDYLSQLRALPSWEEWTTLGSSDSVIWTNQLGACGAYNYSAVTFEGIETATGSSFNDMVVKYRGCYNCPIRCKATVKISRGRHCGFVGDRGEYEPLSSWGPRCGNADGLESIYFCNLCDEYGLDSIGAGNIVAFAMDLYQRGILTAEQTGGLDLTWGNVVAMEGLLRQIAYRSSWLGDVLADGVKHAAAAIGGGASEFAYHVKGLSMTFMDPRGFKASGLGYAVSNRGADFGYVYAKPEYAYTPEQALRAYGTALAADRLAEEGKPAMVRQCMCANAVVDSLGICKIPELGMLMDFDLNIAAEVTTALTGIKVTGSELMRIGERIVNAERLFNYRFGATGRDDTLPAKFSSEPIKEGPCRGSVIKLESMVKEYYALMGWDEGGRTGSAKIKELGLEGLDGDKPLDVQYFI